MIYLCYSPLVVVMVCWLILTFINKNKQSPKLQCICDELGEKGIAITILVGTLASIICSFGLCS